MRIQAQKCSLKIQKREHCSLYIPSGWSLKNIINPKHNGWDWDKCPIKNQCAASAPWTVQCIYQCKQCSKATEIPDRGHGFQPAQTSGRSQIRQTARQGGLYFYLQHSSLSWRGNARGVMHIASMLKGGIKFNSAPLVSLSPQNTRLYLYYLHSSLSLLWFWQNMHLFWVDSNGFRQYFVFFPSSINTDWANRIILSSYLIYNEQLYLFPRQNQASSPLL